MVNFFFEKTSILQFKRAERLNWVDYLSQIGGLLGLGIGFSIVSAAEVVYWSTFRLFANFPAKSSQQQHKRPPVRRRKRRRKEPVFNISTASDGSYLEYDI